MKNTNKTVVSDGTFVSVNYIYSPRVPALSNLFVVPVASYGTKINGVYIFLE